MCPHQMKLCCFVASVQSIVGYPPTQTLSSEEEDLVWKFRFYLSSQKKVRRLSMSCHKKISYIHVSSLTR